MLGIEFSSPVRLLDLRCSACGWEVRVDHAERELARLASERTSALKADQVTRAEYEEQIRELRATFVRVLESLTEVWACAACGEENPARFDSCWSCQAAKIHEAAPPPVMQPPSSGVTRPTP